MNKGFLALLALTLAAGCHGGPAEQAPLAGARLGGPFTLTDQDGRRFSSAALAGKYAVVYFGYTFCPDVCPTDMLVLGQGMRALEKKDPAKAARVQPVFVTVDPERDTPPVIKRFVGAFHPRLIGLTGTPAEIASVAKSYGVFFQKQPPAKDGGGYLVDHSRQAVLFGPDAKPIALVPVDTDGDQVAATLEKWVG